MDMAGATTSDARVEQLVALSAEYFVSNVANAAFQFCKIRNQGASKKTKEDAFVLRTEDLVAALKDVGVNVQKPEYLAEPNNTSSNTSK